MIFTYEGKVKQCNPGVNNPTLQVYIKDENFIETYVVVTKNNPLYVKFYNKINIKFSATERNHKLRNTKLLEIL